MTDQIKGLTTQIRELEDLLIFMGKYQLVISHNGLLVLYDQLRDMKQRLVQLEYDKSILIQKQIIEN
jgi:hypothetical protein